MKDEWINRKRESSQKVLKMVIKEEKANRREKIVNAIVLVEKPEREIVI